MTKLASCAVFLFVVILGSPMALAMGPCRDEEPTQIVGLGGFYISAPMGISLRGGAGIPIDTTQNKGSRCYRYKVIGVDIEAGRRFIKNEYDRTTYKLGLHYVETEKFFRIGGRLAYLGGSSYEAVGVDLEVLAIIYSLYLGYYQDFQKGSLISLGFGVGI